MRRGGRGDEEATRTPTTAEKEGEEGRERLPIAQVDLRDPQIAWRGVVTVTQPRPTREHSKPVEADLGLADAAGLARFLLRHRSRSREQPA